MLTFLASSALLAAFLGSLYGWGRAAARAVHPGVPLPWAYTAALGMGTLILLGGVLNLARLAYAPALDTLFGVGLALALVPAWDALGRLREAGWRPRLPSGPALWDRLPAALMAAAALFLAATLLPTGMFNHHDDLQKYLARPLQMLATGTVGGNPFDSEGLYSLGSQSFLQGFVVGHFPLTFINAFDAVLCFFLTGLLIDALGRRAGAPVALRVLAVAAFVAVNPQYVNVTSVFSGGVLALALVHAGALWWEAPERDGLRAAVPVGGLAAALMTLKATHVPLAAGSVALLLLLALALRPGRARTLGAAAAAGAGGLAVLLPWMLACPYNYLTPLLEYTRRAATRAARAVTGGAGPGGGGTGGTPDAGPGHALGHLFSSDEVYFGNTYFDYGFLALAIAAAALVLAWRLRARQGPGPVAAGLAVAAAMALYYLAIPLVYTPFQGVRYLAPFLAAVLPAAVLLAAGRPTGETAGEAPGAAVGPKAGSRAWGRPMAIAAGLVLATVLGLFSRQLIVRTQEVFHLHTLASFSFGANNFRYHRFAFGQEVRGEVRAAQAGTAQGTAILAWISTPFHLDFRRNRVLTIPDPDFTRGSAGVPFDAGADGLAAFLRGRGIRYIMWEYSGVGMRTDAGLRQDLATRAYRSRGMLTLQFKAMLRELAAQRAVTHDNGRLQVIDLGPAAD